MGKSLSVDRNYGSINIQLDKQKYVAGDQVNGWVHLNLVKDFPSNSIYLIISGKEKIRLTNVKRTVEGSGEVDSEVFVHKDSNEFYAHSFPLYINFGQNFPQGQYSFPFSFKLNENMPGSFVREYIAHGEKCFGKIKYKVKAGLKDSNSAVSLFEKVDFVVDQRWELPSGPQTKQFSQKLQGICCSNLGVFAMNCYFDKDKFIVGENSTLTVAIDNSDCQSNVKAIKCQLVQTTRLQTSSNEYHDMLKKTLTEVIIPGIKQGEKKIGLDAIPVILPIRTDSEQEASSSGNLISNDFKIIITTEMESCLCYCENPSNEIEVKIFNRQIQYNPYQPQVPNWSPVVMDPFVCTISPQSRMTQDFKNQIYIQPNTEYPPMP
jgi:hypothetical protein